MQADSDKLRAFQLAAGATPSLTQVARGTTDAGYGGSLPVVSSNGATPKTGVVWLVRRTEPPTFEAYNADTLGAPIFTSAMGKWSNPAGNSFLSPMVANGRVYAGAYKTVTVFGLVQ